jgi:MFS transporter, DHA2 family, multidrug resistance protein
MSGGAAPSAAPSAGLVRIMLTVCAMSATVMQALDTTIANVALPYMQGSLGASQDQINWVLTSYIVAAAVLTAPIGWISDRFGRKKLFVICAAGFTGASLLCGVAQTIEQMVLFRLLQGSFGAALVPLSQTTMLEIYPPEQRGMAMSIWGMGVMLGPIMGPTLGGWLTENYSWHWVFLVNLPIGIVTVAGLLIFMTETRPVANLRFDWLGFLALSIGIGSLQLMLDRGEQLAWFESNEIFAEMIVSIAGFYVFFAHSFTTKNPFVDFAMFRDRSFASAVVFMFAVGVILYSTLSLSTPFIQGIMNYPVVTAGELLATRGLGTLAGMIAVGRLMRVVEARTLIFIGTALIAVTLYETIGYTEQTSAYTVVTVGMLQGLGLGLVFVPLSTVAFITLPGSLRTNGSSILTLIRNIGSAIGISIVAAKLTSNTTIFHSQLVESLTPFNTALQMPDVASHLDIKSQTGLGLLDAIVTQQAAIIAYANDYKMLMVVSIIMLPFVFLLGSTLRTMSRAKPEVHAALD